MRYYKRITVDRTKGWLFVCDTVSFYAKKAFNFVSNLTRTFYQNFETSHTGVYALRNGKWRCISNSASISDLWIKTWTMENMVKANQMKFYEKEEREGRLNQVADSQIWKNLKEESKKPIYDKIKRYV